MEKVRFVMTAAATSLDETVAEMRARAAEATPGGWLANGSYVEREDGEWDIARCQCGHLSIRATHDEAAANAAHIAASCPSNVIALADGFDERGREIERLTRERDADRARADLVWRHAHEPWKKQFERAEAAERERDALREMKPGRASQRRQIMRLRHGDNAKCYEELAKAANLSRDRATAAEARVKEMEKLFQPVGTAIIERMGWTEEDPPRFTATLVYSEGPPQNLTFSTVWNEHRVIVVDCDRALLLLGGADG